MTRYSAGVLKLRRRASPLVVLALIASVALVLALVLPAQQPRPATTLSFALLDGRDLALAELRGRPVLVVFWATTCVPCVEEVPELVDVYRKLRPLGLELIAVAMPHDPPMQVQRFVERHAIPYPVTLDVAGRSAQAFGGVDFIPTAFLLSPAGDVVFRQTGKLDLARTRRLVASFLPRDRRVPIP